MHFPTTSVTLNPALTLRTHWWRRLNCLRLYDAFGNHGAPVWIQRGVLIGSNISIPTSFQCRLCDKLFFSSLSRRVWRRADKWKMSLARNLYTHHPLQYPFKSSPSGMTARTLTKTCTDKGTTHTQMPRKLIMSDCSLFSCTTRGFSLKKGQTQNSGWQSNTGTMKKDSMSLRAAVHTVHVWM